MPDFAKFSLAFFLAGLIAYLLMGTLFSPPLTGDSSSSDPLEITENVYSGAESEVNQQTYPASLSSRSIPPPFDLETGRTYNRLRSSILGELAKIDPASPEGLQKIFAKAERMMPTEMTFTILGDELISRGFTDQLIDAAAATPSVSVNVIPLFGRAGVYFGNAYLDSVRHALNEAGLGRMVMSVDKEVAQELMVRNILHGELANPEDFGENVKRAHLRLHAKADPYHFIEELDSGSAPVTGEWEQFRATAMEEIAKLYRRTSKETRKE